MAVIYNKYVNVKLYNNTKLHVYIKVELVTKTKFSIKLLTVAILF